jgi:hypothetical protein
MLTVVDYGTAQFATGPQDKSPHSLGFNICANELRGGSSSSPNYMIYD